MSEAMNDHYQLCADLHSRCACMELRETPCDTIVKLAKTANRCTDFDPDHIAQGDCRNCGADALAHQNPVIRDNTTNSPVKSEFET